MNCGFVELIDRLLHHIPVLPICRAVYIKAKKGEDELISFEWFISCSMRLMVWFIDWNMCCFYRLTYIYIVVNWGFNLLVQFIYFFV